AYAECGSLEAFVTQRFLPESPLTRALRPALAVSPRLRKAASYARPAISPRVIVAQPQVVKRAAYALIGAKTSPKQWIDAVIEAARAAEAVHLPCAGAVEVFRALAGTGKRLYLEQYVGDRRAGREALRRESEALGVADLWYETGGYDWQRIERNE